MQNGRISDANENPDIDWDLDIMAWNRTLAPALSACIVDALR
jgi:hypothetical protein